MRAPNKILYVQDVSGADPSLDSYSVEYKVQEIVISHCDDLDTKAADLANPCWKSRVDHSWGAPPPCLSPTPGFLLCVGDLDPAARTKHWKYNYRDIPYPLNRTTQEHSKEQNSRVGRICSVIETSQPYGSHDKVYIAAHASDLTVPTNNKYVTLIKPQNR
ncbi:unnamed protein product [Pieris macdunnoughi]|uniref:Uncharacterized protein n=1 Tax=Pieris macdunnoughi TaxID=345717 RepID=A0A821T4Q9_9NEOP|nr:unnamed protein product [Pieris macdunnoughi]